MCENDIRSGKPEQHKRCLEEKKEKQSGELSTGPLLYNELRNIGRFHRKRLIEGSQKEERGDQNPGLGLGRTRPKSQGKAR